MGWVIEIAKALTVCIATAVVLALVVMLVPLNNSKATAVDVIFRLTGFRLALVGGLNVVIGLGLTRLSVVGDAAGRWHFSLH
jgi:hypothetical protein